jgi:AMP nucleosidase
MIERLEIARSWLPRYTGMPLDGFGDYILLTNFRTYLTRFGEKFGCDIRGEERPMQAARVSGRSRAMFTSGYGSSPHTSRASRHMQNSPGLLLTP